MSQSLCLSTSAGIESGIWHMTISFLNPFILKVCQCTINVRQIVRWATSAPGLVIIVRGSALLESDCTLTNPLIDDKDDRSVIFDGAVHVCVCVCVCVCICVWICWYTWIMSHYVSERPKTVLWLTSKFAIMSSLNVPLHLKCIATLPCEMYNCFAYCNMTCCM